VKKIPTLFVRNPDDRRYVTDAVTPGCEWVLVGEGVATRKYDGTCVLLDPEGGWWARREVKPGKTPPAGWYEVDRDDVTGKSVGWEPIGSSPFVKFFDEAVKRLDARAPGTYELIGPKINGNPEEVMHHTLVPHADAQITKLAPRDFNGLRDWVSNVRWEGLVWHHPDGRMVKLKRRDFPTDAA
jgi:hypothetical protein